MRRFVAVACVVVLVLTGFVVLAPGVRAQRTGAMVDRLQWYEQGNQAQALLDLESGAMDAYMFPLRTITDIISAKQNPNLATISVGGSLNDLFVNPVPVNQSLAAGKFNPFAIREVREGLNYIIDREFMSREIAGGSLFPHTTIWHKQMPEYGRDAVFFSQLERQYAYNPSFGKSMIFDALGKVPGLAFESGQWVFQGTPVDLQFVIRTEDIRRNLGDYMADQVQNVLGFKVTRVYKTGGGAFAIVYNGPPETAKWHLYTEGWAQTAIAAWADADPGFFYNGGEGSRIWTVYKPEPELADVSDSLGFSRYTSVAERQVLIERAAQLALKNSVRIWLASGGTFAYSKRVTNVVYDLAAGLWGLYATRTARFATLGGNLTIGQRIQFLSPWNPWQGFGWLYDGLQSAAFTDVPVFPHPHTGVYIPVRYNFQVFTAGPTGSIPVPAAAQTWDNTTMGFKAVAAGVTAKSQVNYTVTFGKWHDGSDFNMNDILYEIALVFRRADPAGDVHKKDSDAAGSQTLFLAQFLKGFRVTGTNTIQMWFDFWHPDSTVIAASVGLGVVGSGGPSVGIFPITPWTASELALATVFGNACAVSEVTADIQLKEALDLTKGPCLTAMDGNRTAYVSANHEPPGLAASFADAETTARWTALTTFRNTYGHYFASNGPFILSNVNPTARQTQMIRDPNYPLDAARYDSFLTPRVPQISFGAAPQVVPGLAATFTINSRLAGAPYDNLAINYLIVNPSTGAVLFQGQLARRPRRDREDAGGVSGNANSYGRGNYRWVRMPVVEPHLDRVRACYPEPLQDRREKDCRRAGRVGILLMDVARRIGPAEAQGDLVEDVVHVKGRAVVPLPEVDGVVDLARRGDPGCNGLEAHRRVVPPLCIRRHRHRACGSRREDLEVGTDGYIDPGVRVGEHGYFRERLCLQPVIQPAEALPRVPR